MMFRRAYRACCCEGCAATAAMPPVSVAQPRDIRSTPYTWPQVRPYPAKDEKSQAIRPAWPKAPPA